MNIYRFDSASGKRISKFDSNFIMSRIAKTGVNAHIGCMHLDAGGIVGYHEAVIPQLLVVVGGEGVVRTENEEKTVKAGDAVFWQKGEGHETRTDSGLTAIVIESEDLSPLMPEK
ncbi:cupin domain-containing protein [Fictibacillus iocasae]|uniref:Cupin domain-containing protein n=1 Tax=Fictibacillus iocasae TaxID=2715437 RepID=A0ABW2NRC9_9BACL